MRARRLVPLLIHASLLGGIACAYGQDGAYPAKPLRFLVPQAPGGHVDTIARAIGQRLGERLGQPVVVENRVGANGVIASDAVAKAPPDGHTLLMTAQASLVVNVALRKSLPFDPIADFASITMLFDTPYYLVVHPSVPAGSVQELLVLARAQPGKLNYGTSGVGSGQHLYTEIFKHTTKTNLVHVPYKSNAHAGADLLAGQVQVMLQGSAFTLAQARSAKIRVLASTGSQRMHGLPDVPTVIEAGVPGFTASTWYGLAGPARLPRVIIDRLNREVGEFLRAPAVRDKFAAMDIILAPGTPEALSELVRAEIPIFVKAARDAGIEPE